MRGKKTREEGQARPVVRGVPMFYEVMRQLSTSSPRHAEHYPLLGKIVVQSWRKIVKISSKQHNTEWGSGRGEFHQRLIPPPGFRTQWKLLRASALRAQRETKLERYTPPVFNWRAVIRAEKSTSTNPRFRACASFRWMENNETSPPGHGLSRYVALIQHTMNVLQVCLTGDAHETKKNCTRYRDSCERE